MREASVARQDAETTLAGSQWPVVGGGFGFSVASGGRRLWCLLNREGRSQCEATASWRACLVSDLLL